MLRFVAGILLVSRWARSGREIVIFDTDSGLFGDDGAALVMLLRSPAQAAIHGITVTPGNVWPAQGAEYMFHILELLKRPQVPVVYRRGKAPGAHRRHGAGIRAPLGDAGATPAHSRRTPAAVSRRPEHQLTNRKTAPEGAVAFLIAEIERHPGELTILAIGPMTNIALALRLKPEMETKIKQIVFMGGNIRVAGNASPAAEFNFWFDPEAARIVLRSRIPKKVMFGLDICNLAVLSKAEFDQIAAAHTPITDLFREDLGNRYPGFLKHPEATAHMWDSLAAAYLIDPGFVTKSETRYLDVQTAWGQFYGSTMPLDRRVAPDATPVRVMLDLDFKRVFALYKDRLTRRD